MARGGVSRPEPHAGYISEKEMPVTYQCCFCGLGIDSVVPDTGSLLYTTCVDGPVQKRHAQEMFCHCKCLNARLHPSVHLYAAFLAEQDGLDEGESATSTDEVRRVE
jgi:hypothetical protein